MRPSRGREFTLPIGRILRQRCGEFSVVRNPGKSRLVAISSGFFVAGRRIFFRVGGRWPGVQCRYPSLIHGGDRDERLGNGVRESWRVGDFGFGADVEYGNWDVWAKEIENDAHGGAGGS